MNRLWRDNAFLNKAFNDDQYVIGNQVVHIPQPGSRPVIDKNNTVFPVAAVERADNDIMYVLDKYTSRPTHIQAADLQEISYDKIASVFGDHAGQLVEVVADDMIIKWLTGIPAGNTIRTSGAAVSAKVTGQTGNRRATVHDDLRRAKLVLDLQGAPQTDRYALFESNMMDELVQSLSNTQHRDFSQYMDAKEGVVGRLYGFNIMDRSRVAIATAALAIEPLGASVDATDHVVSFCWQKDAVARAIGERRFFEDKDNPLYYGDVYSALLRAGGRRRRSNHEGVVAIVQDTAA
jgi:hypothetical protein